MRWRVGALFALASVLVTGYWQAVLPRPQAQPRVLAQVPVGVEAALGSRAVTVRSVHAQEADGGARSVTVDLSTRVTGGQTMSCEVRIRAGARTWLAPDSDPCAAQGDSQAVVLVPPGVGQIVVEVRMAGVEPRSIQVTGVSI